MIGETLEPRPFTLRVFAARGADVTVADINPAMLEVGMARARRRGLTGLVWAQENAEQLSFPAASFEAYTIATALYLAVSLALMAVGAFLQMRAARSGGR